MHRSYYNQNVATFLTEYGYILCPNCGCENTHVDVVDMINTNGQYVRLRASGEDEYARIAVEQGAAEAAPQTRRHQIVVYVFCEECDVITPLSLTQNKGTTYLDRQPTPLLAPANPYHRMNWPPYEDEGPTWDDIPRGDVPTDEEERRTT